MPPDADDHPQYALFVPAGETFAVVRRPDSIVIEQGRPTAVVDADGLLPVGALCLGIDHAVGARLATALAPDERMVTSHLHLELVRPPTTATVRAEAELVHRDGASALARATITDDDGELVALATARFALFPAHMTQGGMVGDPAAAVAGAAGRASAHPLTDGHPIHALLGTRVLAAGADVPGLRATVVATAPLANERAGLHGGVGALVGERTSDLALRAARPDGRPMRAVELRVAFLRPVPCVGETLECRAEVVHLGRSVAMTRAVLLTPDGRLAVTVDGMHAAG